MIEMKFKDNIKICGVDICNKGLQCLEDCGYGKHCKNCLCRTCSRGECHVNGERMKNKIDSVYWKCRNCDTLLTEEKFIPDVKCTICNAKTKEMNHSSNAQTAMHLILA